MKNKLVPITPCNNAPGEWEPSLIAAHNSGRPVLVNTDGALRIRTGKECPRFHSLHFRTDLGGLVHQGGYLPVVQSEEVGTFFVQDPDDYVIAAFEEAKKA